MKPPRRPNILFITCDQWRGDCLSAVGHPTLRTPAIDALTADGVTFRSHFAGAAPCSPARACLYTGRYQMTNRVCRNGTPLDARLDTIAKAARRLGYDPTLFGYSDTAPDPRGIDRHDPVLSSYEGVLPGFTVRQLLPEHQKPWLSWLATRGHDVGAGCEPIHAPVGVPAGAVSSAAPVYSRDETPTAFLAGEVLRWAGEQVGARPWFAHVSLISPHPPFSVPAPYNTLYDPQDGPAFRRGRSWKQEGTVHPYLAFAYSRQKRANFVPGAKGLVRDLSETDFRTIRATYYGMISEVDAQLGRLFGGLKALGAWDDTVVVLTSDHAEMMGEHFMLGKGGFFDGSYHIPLIVRDPRRTASRGRMVEAITEAVDIAPTLVELMGGRAPADVDGHSLVPFVDGTTPQTWRDAAHWEFDFRSIAKGTAERALGLSSRQCNLAVLRTREAKYVHFGGGLPPLLYDLRADPDELVDRAGDPACRELRLDMAERMLAWRAAHLDQTLAFTELTEAGPVTLRAR